MWSKGSGWTEGLGLGMGRGAGELVGYGNGQERGAEEGRLAVGVFM